MRRGGSVILPGAVLGVLGGGQLGRMFALAARERGYRVHIFSPEEDAPAAQVADREIVADYLDEVRLREFAKGVAAVTFEFENVPVGAAAVAEEETIVRPAGRVLHVTQHRLREKGFLRDNGFPVTPFREVRSREELGQAVTELGLPGVLKTAGFGYDGKGQSKVLAASDLDGAWSRVGGVQCIYEAFVRFEKELSVIAARGVNGEFAAFPVFENAHANHILDVTFAPAAIGPKQAAEAVDLARAILERLDVVGLLTVELFLDTSGRILVNELAPRPHNSGHLTIGGSVTSQFEQQLRAVCGLPLGSAELVQPAAMANLLGDVWAGGEPAWASALEDPGIKLHLYGKAEARPGRKMGHLSVSAPSVREAVDRVTRARERLLGRPE